MSENLKYQPLTILKRHTYLYFVTIPIITHTIDITLQYVIEPDYQIFVPFLQPSLYLIAVKIQ